MKKKLLMSLFTIAIVSAMLTGGAIAYFSDTEKSVGNTFTAGVIDIELSHLDSAGRVINIDDIKPSQIKYGFFDIHGINGTNPGPVFLHITGVSTDQGAPSLSAERAAQSSNGIRHDIDSWLTVSLIRVTERPDDGLTPEEMAAWLDQNTDEVIIHHDDHMKLSDLNSAIIPVGRITGPSDRIWLVMDVHLQKETPNDYQGDTVSFDIEVTMTQDGAPTPVHSGNKLILENKVPSNWAPILGDGIWGTVKYTYDAGTSTLSGSFTATGLPDGPYDLIYYSDPWPGTGGVVLGTGTSNGGALPLTAFSGTPVPSATDTNIPPGVKVWLVPAGEFLPGPPATWPNGWNPSSYLFEIILINLP